MVDPIVISRVLDARPSLKADQRAMVSHLLGGGRALEIVIGEAGTAGAANLVKMHLISRMRSVVFESRRADDEAAAVAAERIRGGAADEKEDGAEALATLGINLPEE